MSWRSSLTVLITCGAWIGLVMKAFAPRDRARSRSSSPPSVPDRGAISLGKKGREPALAPDLLEGVSRELLHEGVEPLDAALRIEDEDDRVGRVDETLEKRVLELAVRMCLAWLHPIPFYPSRSTAPTSPGGTGV